MAESPAAASLRPQRVRQKELIEFLRFLRRTGHVLTRYPDLLPARAANEPEGSLLAERAQGHRAAGWARPWFAWLDKPRHRVPRLLRIEPPAVARAVRISADGTLALALHEDRSLRTWDLLTGAELAQVLGTRNAQPRAFTLRGSEATVAHENGTVDRWDSRTGAPLGAWLVSGGELAGIACVRDDVFALVISDAGRLRVVRVNDGSTAWQVDLGNRRGRLSVSVDPPRLLVAVSDVRVLSVWAPESGWRDIAVPSADAQQDLSCAWLVADGGRWAVSIRTWLEAAAVLFVVEQHARTGLFDAAAGREVAGSFSGLGALACCVCEPGRIVAIGGDHTSLVDLATLEKRASVPAPVASPDQFAFSGDGSLLVTATPEGIELWDIEELLQRTSPAPQLGADIESPKFCRISRSSGRVMISGTWQATWYCHEVIDFSGRRLAMRGNTMSLEEPAEISPTGNDVVAAWGNAGLVLWRLEPTRGVSEAFEQRWTRAFDQGPALVAFSGDGRLVASLAEDGQIHILNAESGRDVATLSGQPGTPMTLEFLPGDDQLLTQVAGAAAQLWDWTTRRERRRLSGSAWRFSPDGRWVAGVQNTGDVVVQELGRAEPLVCLESSATGIASLVFVPTERLVCTRDNGEVAVWEVVQRRRIAWLVDRDRAVSGAAIAPDGTAVVMHSSKLLRLRTLPGLNEICRHWIDDGEIWHVAWRDQDGVLVVVLRSGRLHLLRPVLSGTDRPIGSS